MASTKILPHTPPLYHTIRHRAENLNARVDAQVYFKVKDDEENGELAGILPVPKREGAR